MKFSIIIPTYNNADLLKECIESIIKYTDLKDTEVIVVANGCTDATESYLEIKNSMGEASVIWDTEAIGYPKAINQGIKEARGEFIILLNDDTKLLPQPQSQWIDMLYAPFKNRQDKVGITGPQMMSKAESLNRDFMCFFCVMLRKEMIDEIGLLDEIFSPGYSEDIDYSFRAISKGWKVEQVPNDERPFYDNLRRTGTFPIYHEGTRTFSRPENQDEQLIIRNNQIIFDRYSTPMNKIDKELKQATSTVLYQSYAGWISDLETVVKNNPDKTEPENEGEHFDGFKDVVVPEREGGTIPEKGKNFLEVDSNSPLCELLETSFWNALNQQRDIADFPEIKVTPMTEKSFDSEINKNIYFDEPPLHGIRDDGTAYFNTSRLIELKVPQKNIDISRAQKIDGFMADSELQYLAELASTSKVFIEVGSWHGKSTAAIADNLPEGAVLFCVDTWKGSSNEQDTSHASAKENDGDHAFLEFCDNHFENISKGKIIPIRMQSNNAARMMLRCSINADVVFIDANHSYTEVIRDISNWIRVLDKDGIMCGHDYNTQYWPDVTNAVNTWFKGFPIHHIENTSIWSVDCSEEYIGPTERPTATPRTTPCVFDCIPFNNELDILEMRLTELYEVVDRFIIVEARQTHSGMNKPLYFHENYARFERFLNKITHLVIEEFPNVDPSNPHWSRERYQRDFARNGLRDCIPDDIIISCDCDEIPTEETIRFHRNSLDKYKISDFKYSLQMDLFYYNLHTKADLKWTEGKVVSYKLAAEQGLTSIRYEKHYPQHLNAGWHLSYAGSAKDIVRKIEATAHQEYNQPLFKNIGLIQERMNNGEDVFGRPEIKFKTIDINTIQLPKWFEENKDNIKIKKYL